jgi:hypothetical protein
VKIISGYRGDSMLNNGRGMNNKKNKLVEEIWKIRDTGKSKIIKKYNLSILDIKTIGDLLEQKYTNFIQGSVAMILKDYGYDVQNNEVGFELKE